MKYDMCGGCTRFFDEKGNIIHRLFIIKNNNNLKYLPVVIWGRDINQISYQDVINTIESTEDIEWDGIIEFTEENFIKELNR